MLTLAIFGAAISKWRQIIPICNSILIAIKRNIFLKGSIHTNCLISTIYV